VRFTLLVSLLLLGCGGEPPRERFGTLEFHVPLHVRDQVSLYTRDCAPPPRVVCPGLRSADAGWELKFSASLEDPVDAAFWGAEVRLSDGRLLHFDAGREVERDPAAPVWTGRIMERRGEPCLEFHLELEPGWL